MISRKMKNSKTSGTKVSEQGSKGNFRFAKSTKCRKHFGKKPSTRKKMLCTDHAANKWGFEHSCCSKGTKCGFAHQFSHQIVDHENHKINTMIRHAVANNNSSAFSELKLTTDMIDHFVRRSRICKRFLSCYQKKIDGTLKKSDICPGGANCKGGICGDSYDYDFSKSLFLDEGDWKYGRPYGKGICLTDYGLIPLVTQKQRAAELKAIAEEKEKQDKIKKMLTDKASFPSLGSKCKIVPASSSTTWGKSKDWNSVASSIKEEEEKQSFLRRKELARIREAESKRVASSYHDFDQEDSYDDDYSDHDYSDHEDEYYYSEEEYDDWEDRFD